MTREDIQKRVFDIYHEQLGVDEKNLALDKNIVDDLGADDLDEIECIVSLEEEFGYAITEEEAVGIKTIGDAVNLIEKKLGDENAPLISSIC